MSKPWKKPDQETLFSGEGITVTFGSTVALWEVSFQVVAGRHLGIAGESGSGKTTLARVLVGLQKPQKGRLTFQGKPFHPDRFFYQKVQMVFQNPFASVNPFWRVEHILQEGRFLVPMKREEIIQTLRQVGLDTWILDKTPKELSGGQCQRVVIARALLTKPRVLILDEPISSLDVSIQAQLLNLFKKLAQDRSLTYIFISHDLSSLRFLCPEILILYRGHLVEKGATKQVLSHPFHPYTHQLLQSEAFMLPKQEGGENKSEAACPFFQRCPKKQEKCQKDMPLLREGSLDHWVACHFPEET